MPPSNPQTSQHRGRPAAEKLPRFLAEFFPAALLRNVLHHRGHCVFEVFVQGICRINDYHKRKDRDAEWNGVIVAQCDRYIGDICWLRISSKSDIAHIFQTTPATYMYQHFA